MSITTPPRQGIIHVKITVLFLSAIFLLLFVINASYPSKSVDDWRIIRFLFVAVLLLQAGAVYLLNRYTPFFANILYAFLFVINLFSLFICIIPPFSAMPAWFLILGLLLTSLITYEVCDLIFSTKRICQLASVIISLLCIWQLVIYFIQEYPTPVATNSDQTASKNVSLVELIDKPNIYLISFDALAPLAITQRYINTQSLPYQSWIENNDFRRFRNAFSAYSQTLPTLNSILAFDKGYYKELESQHKESHLFNGLAPSPLLQLLKYNGYTTNTYYQNTYLGGRSGVHVDSYHPDYPYTICYNHIAKLGELFSFFGYCQLMKNKLFLQLWGIPTTHLNGMPPVESHADSILQDIENRLQQQNPHFFMAHLTSPNHTPRPYNHNDMDDYNAFRDHFIDVAKNQTTPLMEKIHSFIRQHDPNGIIIYYGDHGLWLSRHLSFNLSDYSKEEDDFLMFDRHGILLAMSPANTCQSYIDESTALGQYADVTLLLRQIMRCLTNGYDPMPSATYAIEKQYKWFEGLHIKNKTVPYSELLYE